MAERHDHDELADALRALRGDVHRRVRAPEVGMLRARATQQLRVRQGVAAVLALLAVAVGGGALLRTSAAPAPPIETPNPWVSPSPEPSGEPIPPSPRPAPVSPEPLDDPIVEVDWRTATVTLPPFPGCPTGQITFRQDPSGHTADWAAHGPEGYPRIGILADRRPAGDLTGDGRAEAVISATCFADEEDSGDGKWQLMVVTRTEAGELRALAMVGPRGAIYHGYWISGGYLYLEASPNTGEDFDTAPGMALRYRWEGNGFSEPEVAPDYTPIASVTDDAVGAPVWPGPAVASALHCPDQELRFSPGGPPLPPDIPLGGYTAVAGDAVYTLGSEHASGYLYDLDRTGVRLLVAALGCERTDSSTGDTTITLGLAIFEPVDGGWRGISVLVRPTVVAIGPATVTGDVPAQRELTAEGLLSLVWLAADRDRVMATPQYGWTGTELTPVTNGE